MTFWGGLSCYQWMRMGRGRELPYLIMSTLLIKLKFPEKTNSDLIKVDGEQLDDLISYNQLMEYLKDNFDTGQHEDGLYKFKPMKDGRGRFTSTDPEYLGSSYNLLIEWETGEMTW